MDSPFLLIVLRLLHILGAIVWAGGAIVVAMFVLPSVRALGPAGGPVMREIAQVRKLPLVLLTTGWITVISGLVLYLRAGMVTANAWFATTPAMVFGVGAILGIVVVLMGTLINLPTAKRIGALGAKLQAEGGPPPPEVAAEMQRLQRRMLRASQAAAGLLLLAAATMAVARYL